MPLFGKDNQVRIKVSKTLHQFSGWGNPSFRIGASGQSSGFFGFLRVVRKPAQFAGIFQPGERIFDVHIDSKSPKRIAASVRKFQELIPELKARGFAGFCLDTSNNVLAGFLQKTFGMQKAQAPKSRIAEVKRRYKTLAKYKRYPKKFLETPVERFVVRF